MKNLFTVFAFAIFLMLSGCGASKSEIETSAKALTQKIIDQNETLKNLGIVVDRVDAIQESNNKYQGIAQVMMNGEHHQVNISILADGDKVLVKTEDGAFAFTAQAIIKKAFENATTPMPTNAPAEPVLVNQTPEPQNQEKIASTREAETVMPSFDCTKATSHSERLICADPELSTMDAEMSSLYSRAKSVASDKSAFAAETKARWKQRETECSDKSCLVAWYTLRKGELLAWLPN